SHQLIPLPRRPDRLQVIPGRGALQKGTIPMAQVYRPVYTVTDPATGKKSKRKSRTWHVCYWTPDGRRVRVKGYRDKRVTEALAISLERRAARLAEGLADPMDELAKKPLVEHL